MADLTGTYFANNYNNALAPFSQFGTRRLQLFLVEIDFDGDDDFDTWYDPGDMVNAWYSNDPAQSYIDRTDEVPPVTDHNTYFAKAVRGIQLNAELYLLGRPGGYYFYFMVAEDTGLHQYDDLPHDVQKMADAIHEAIGYDYDVYVWKKRFRGNGIWSMSNTNALTADGKEDRTDAVKSSLPSKKPAAKAKLAAPKK